MCMFEVASRRRTSHICTCRRPGTPERYTHNDRAMRVNIFELTHNYWKQFTCSNSWEIILAQAHSNDPCHRVASTWASDSCHSLWPHRLRDMAALSMFLFFLLINISNWFLVASYCWLNMSPVDPRFNTTNIFLINNSNWFDGGSILLT